ncbi:MAG TPA: hypothetical protein PK347_00385 [Burkholderiaceae bacterium]|nr:hypothetical protein [Burkholderiaceae bacterium]
MMYATEPQCRPAFRLPHSIRDARAEDYRKRLLAAGAILQQLATGATRIMKGSNFLTVADLADLTHADMERLCG